MSDGLGLISIVPGYSTDGYQCIQLFGSDVRVEIDGDEPWFVLNDLSKMLGLHENTFHNKIANNPEEFEGWTHRGHVTWTRTNLSQFEINQQSLLLVNEQAVYLLLAGVSTKRIKNPDVKERVISFKRAFPELLKKIRRGELLIVKNEEWNVNRYLSTKGAKFLAKQIREFIGNLAKDPSHENFVMMNNHKMINKIVFGFHKRGIRDFASIEQLEAVYNLELHDSYLINDGHFLHTERKARLEEHFKNNYPELHLQLEEQKNQKLLKGF